MVLKKQGLKQSGSLSASHTPKRSLKNGFPTPRYMMILRRLILEKFQESTYSQEDSHAKTSAMLEKELASRGVVLASGSITLKRLGRYDPESRSLKTCQRCLTEDSMLSLQTLPKSGMMRSGIVYQLPALARCTVVKESSSLLIHPTPDTSGLGGSNARKAYKKRMMMFPTPTKQDYKRRGPNSKQQGLPEKIYKEGGGQLNPIFVEWLMGFPLGWTRLEKENEEKTRRIKTMRHLWNSDAQEAIRQAFRGLNSLQQKEVLQSFVCQYEEESHNSWTEVESRTNALRILREVWKRKATSCPSQRQKHSEQSSRKYSDTLCLLPCKTSSRTTKGGRVTMKVKNRVDRIKCLGNAVVPQLAEVFAKAIQEEERGTKE